MAVPALCSLIDAALLSDIVNAPENAELKPAIQKMIRMQTRRYPNPVQQLSARKTFLLERYRKDSDARKQELSQLLYGYLNSREPERIKEFAEYAKEERGPDDEIFFSEAEMNTAIEALRGKCDERFLFLHTYAFALLQERPEFLEPLRGAGGSLGEWVAELLPG